MSCSKVSLDDLDLLPEELELLVDSDRCSACGHLCALHTMDTCEYCNVEGCPCENGKLRQPPTPSRGPLTGVARVAQPTLTDMALVQLCPRR